MQVNGKNRIQSIDIVRGLVMIIMALDHVRDLMHIHSIADSPTNLATTNVWLFFTRFITHLCAPIFVFLAGTSVYLLLQKSNNVTETKKWLFKRGLWLIILEFTLVNFAIFFDPGFHTNLFEVIAAIGFGFIILALILRLPTHVIGLTGLAIIFFHQLVSFLPFGAQSTLVSILNPFFNLSVIPITANNVLVIAYPPIPWLGIMLIGFATGKYFLLDKDVRNKTFLKLGFTAFVLFIVIRAVNIYGDTVPWTTQKNELFTFLSFMNISKYPPSLIFCLFTLGVMFFLLYFADQFNHRIKNVLLVYGKVPLFYFVVHFYLIHVFTILMLMLQGINWSQLEFASGTFGRPKNLETGIPLWAVYLMWLFVVVILYKPCVWFGKYKATHDYWWLRYL